MSDAAAGPATITKLGKRNASLEIAKHGVVGLSPRHEASEDNSVQEEMNGSSKKSKVASDEYDIHKTNGEKEGRCMFIYRYNANPRCRA